MSVVVCYAVSKTLSEEVKWPASKQGMGSKEKGSNNEDLSIG